MSDADRLSDDVDDNRPSAPRSQTRPGSTPVHVRGGVFPDAHRFHDWPDAATCNGALKQGIYAWPAEEPDGIQRSNVRVVCGWHSATTMHQQSATALGPASASECLEKGQQVFEERPGGSHLHTDAPLGGLRPVVGEPIMLFDELVKRATE